jgi:hypothetical protein
MSNVNIMIVEVAGIVASGVIGPTLTTFAVRKAELLRLASEQHEHRRDALRDLIDETAVVVGEASKHVRDAAHAARFGDPEPELDEWATRVGLLERRLRLHLEPTDPVITSLHRIIDLLASATEAGHGNGGQGYDGLGLRLDAAHNTFLEEGRAALQKGDFAREGAVT